MAEVLGKILRDVAPGRGVEARVLRDVAQVVRDAPLSPSAGSTGKLVAVMTYCLNSGECGLEAKEAALDVAATLAEFPENHPILHSMLSALSSSFESFFEASVKSHDAATTANLCRSLLCMTVRLGHNSLSGHDMLEIVGSVHTAIAGLVAVFSSTKVDPTVKVALVRTMLELTYPDTYFGLDGHATDQTKMENLTRQFNRNINSLIRACMEEPIIPALSNMLSSWLTQGDRMSDLDDAMESTLLFIRNMLQYASEMQAQIRKHLAVSTQLISQAVLPYLLGQMNMAARCEFEDSSVPLLQACLTVLVLATFRVNVLRPQFRRYHILSKLLEGPDQLYSMPSIVALLIKLAVNVDFAVQVGGSAAVRSRQDRRRRGRGRGGRHAGGARHGRRRARKIMYNGGQEVVMDSEAEGIVEVVRTIILDMTKAQRTDLWKRLAAPDPATPVDRTCQSYEVLSFAFDAIRFGLEETAAAVPAEADAAVAAVAGDDDDDEEGDVRVHVTPQLGAAALSQLNEWQAARSHASSPTAEIEAQVKAMGLSPSSPPMSPVGTPDLDDLSDDEPSTAGKQAEEPEADDVFDTTEEGVAAKQTSDMWKAAGAAEETARQMSEMRVARAAMPSLKGVRAPHHLPPLARPMRAGDALSSSNSKLADDSVALGRKPVIGEAPAIAPEPTAAVNIPARYMCLLSGELMTDPVKLPDGRIYSRASLEQWLTDHTTAPDSEVPLSMADVVPQEELAKEIGLFKFRWMMQTASRG